MGPSDASYEHCDVCKDPAFLQPVLDEFNADEWHIDVSVGQAISRERNLGQQLLHLVPKFNSVCIVCFVAQKLNVNHGSIFGCPNMKGLCL